MASRNGRTTSSDTFDAVQPTLQQAPSSMLQTLRTISANPAPALAEVSAARQPPFMAPTDEVFSRAPTLYASLPDPYSRIYDVIQRDSAFVMQNQDTMVVEPNNGSADITLTRVKSTLKPASSVTTKSNDAYSSFSSDRTMIHDVNMTLFQPLLSSDTAEVVDDMLAFSRQLNVRNKAVALNDANASRDMYGLYMSSGKQWLVGAVVIPPISPAPSAYLQLANYGSLKNPDGSYAGYSANATIKVAMFSTDYATGRIVQAAYPVPLRALLGPDRTLSPPTETQWFRLATSLLNHVDGLLPSLYVMLTVDSVWIMNPWVSGTSESFEYKLDPYALGLTSELAPGTISRHTIMRKHFALLMLHFAIGLGTLPPGPELRQRFLYSVATRPAYAALVNEIWAVTQNDNADARVNLLIQNLSPTARAMIDVLSMDIQEWDPSHLRGLLSGIMCHDSSTIYKASLNGLWSLVNSNALNRMLPALIASIALLVPRGPVSIQKSDVLDKPDNWIKYMTIIERILSTIYNLGQYGLLRMAQQALLDAGITTQLILDRAQFENARLSFRVLGPMIRVGVMMAFQFPTVASRIMSPSNVLRMSQMLDGAYAHGAINELERNKAVVMMLVMSDFGAWAQRTPEMAQESKKWIELWDQIDDDVFLTYAVPCWTPALSLETTVVLVRRLESIFMDHVNMVDTIPAEQKPEHDAKLYAISNYLVSFAWNAPIQVSAASYRSILQSDIMALLFHKHGHTLFTPVTKMPEWFLDPNYSARVPPAISLPNQPMPISGVPVATRIPNQPFPAQSGVPAATRIPNQPFPAQNGVPVVTRIPNQPFPAQNGVPVVTRIPNQPFPAQSGVPVATRIPNQPFPVPSGPRANVVESMGTSIPIENAIVLSLKAYQQFNPLVDAFSPIATTETGYPIDAVPEIVNSQKLDMSARYVPTPQLYGAPQDPNKCTFVLPNMTPSDFARVALRQIDPTPQTPGLGAGTVARYNVAQTPTAAAFEAAKKLFYPVTICAATAPMVNTSIVAALRGQRANTPVTDLQTLGTTGMMEVGILDGGDTNALVIGITWSIAEDYLSNPYRVARKSPATPSTSTTGSGGSQTLYADWTAARNASNDAYLWSPTIPGTTLTSFGFVAATGDALFCVAVPGRPDMVHQMRVPVAPPCATGSQVAIGISGTQVYVVVDNTYYPILDGLTLPPNANVYPLIHLGTPGIQLRMRVMGSIWDPSIRTPSGAPLAHKTTNPVAYQLYLAQIRAEQCPHYFAQALDAAVRPQIPALSPNIEVLGKLSAEVESDIDLVRLANLACTCAEGCTTVALNQKIGTLRIDFANQLLR